MSTRMSTGERQKLAKLQAQCDRFNADTSVGSEVLVRTDNIGNIITRTTSPAQVLSGHTAVIWLEGISGCYLLSRVSKILLRFEKIDGKLIPRSVLKSSEAPATDPPASPNSNRTEQPCEHVQLNEDGICRTCGADRRGI